MRLENESREQLKRDVDKKKTGQMKAKKKKKEENSRREEPEERKHMPALPFPQKLSRETMDKKKLENEIREIRSAPKSLQLVNQTTIIPEGIVEDVLIWVDKFVFSMDFIVVNMEEYKEVPIILGRPFLATSRDILDIHEKKLMLRVGDETVTFKMDVAKGAQKDKPAPSVE
ncbi:uncharacterized protein [Nicotiana tomentosiformis]|uniref:uncharacterized protein n=1 Tax=Nicotiana tomentosiformis TaxID=4098 RepID=UPI00388CAEAF